VNASSNYERIQKTCRRLGEIVFNDKSAILINKIILVGDDVDAYDLKEVMWAYSTRCRPVHDEYSFDDVPGFAP
jgi:phenacrylate decarboxylase